MTCLVLTMCGKSGLELMSLDFQSVASSVFWEAGEEPEHHEPSCVGAGVMGGVMLQAPCALVPAATRKASLLLIQSLSLPLETFVEETHIHQRNG